MDEERELGGKFTMKSSLWDTKKLDELMLVKVETPDILQK